MIKLEEGETIVGNFEVDKEHGSALTDGMTFILPMLLGNKPISEDGRVGPFEFVASDMAIIRIFRCPKCDQAHFEITLPGGEAGLKTAMPIGFAELVAKALANPVLLTDENATEIAVFSASEMQDETKH